MKRSLAGAAAASLLFATHGLAEASSLPPVKVSSSNNVPQCVTPGRLMVFLAQRNPRLDQRYAGIATAYMRHGEQLGIRWDYAFWQMMLETGSLSYTRNGTKPGDVKPKQNNFAGLGATGKGEPGESFPTIEDGVKAHLQHLLMYSGEHVEEPVAERTRKVQEWGVLTSWQKGFKRPITFSDLASKWAPGSRGYARDVDSFREDFQENHCDKPDPRPELTQEARASAGASPVKTAAARAETRPAARVETPSKSAGAELARQAMERARSEGGSNRTNLGGSSIVAPKPFAGETAPTPGFTILNGSSPEAGGPAVPPSPPAADAASKKQAPIHAASAAASIKPPARENAAAAAQAAPASLPKATGPSVDAGAPTTSAKCRVYTASYGGQKAVIIRASADQYTNFTVLDVNDGQEAREIEAYVSAYAKGGLKVGEFSSTDAALDKAFQLCPEG